MIGPRRRSPIVPSVAPRYQPFPLACAAQTSTNSASFSRRRAGRAMPRGGTACSRPAGRAGAGPRPCRRRASGRDLERAVAVLRRLHREAVVLARDEHAARLCLEDRVVGAAVAEGQLERLEPERAAEQLVPEADAVSGRSWSTIARTSATCACIEPGSPGPFASSTPSGASSSTCARRRVVREHRDAGSGRLEQAHDRGLGAVVEHDDMAARVRRAAPRRAAPRDLAGEQPARHRGLGRQQLERRVARDALAAGDARASRRGRGGGARAHACRGRERDDPLLDASQSNRPVRPFGA